MFRHSTFLYRHHNIFTAAKLKRTVKSKRLFKEGKIFPWQKRIRQRITACMSIDSTNEIFQIFVGRCVSHQSISCPAWVPGLSSISITSSKIMREDWLKMYFSSKNFPQVGSNVQVHVGSMMVILDLVLSQLLYSVTSLE